MPQSKFKSLEALDGGYDRYIATLDRIRRCVLDTPEITKSDLKHWYWQNHSKWRAHQVAGGRALNAGGRFDDTTDAYINALFKCGLLIEDEAGGPIHCKGLPRKKADKNRKVVETIDENVVFVVDMLREISEAKEWITEEQIRRIAGKKYRVKLREIQIQYRRGWLQSAGMVEADGRRLRATSAGVQLLEDGQETRPSRRVHVAEFNGRGEGEEHRALKEHVFAHCEELLRERIETRAVECELASGDRPDVTAGNESTVWHIEVKSRLARNNDIKRGLYQCVKYRAVGGAMERAESPNTRRNARALLVVGTRLPRELRRLARALRVRVLVCRLPHPSA